MTDNALHTHTGGTDAVTSRLIDGGLLAVQGPGLLDVRTGVLFGPGSRTLVTGTSDTGPMTVAIAAHHWVASRGSANGAYRGVKTASTKVPVGAAPGAGAGTRIDVVYEKQQDSTDGVPSKDDTTGPLYAIEVGTPGLGKPAIPVGAEELATVAVSPGATATNGANVVITNTARQTVAHGAPVPVSSKDERDALTKYVGLSVKRLDDGGREERYTGTGDIWASPGDVPVLASIAARNAYFSGNLRAGASALVAGELHVYDGAAWRFTLHDYGEATCDPAGFMTLPISSGGQTPQRFGASPTGQANDTVTSLVGVPIAWSANGTSITFRIYRQDTNVPFNGNLIKLNWWAKF